MSQQTFTQEEIKEAGKMLNLVFEKAKWGSDLSSKEVQEIGRFFNWAHKHLVKMEQHVFELVKDIPPPNEEEPKQLAKKSK